MKTAIIQFTNREFNSVNSKEIKFKEQETPELTFKFILNKLKGSISKTWESVEFEFEEKTVVVLKSWLIETNFDFSQSHTIE